MNLGKRVWDAVETDQGKAFVSDDLEDWPDARVIEVLPGIIYHQRRALRKLERIWKEVRP